MAIYRGAGGSGDAVNDASSEALITIQARDAALAAQAAAEAAQAAAELAETNAETAETNAETAETNAETAEANAETAQAAAEAAQTAAELAETNAETAETNAAASASAASTSASNASTSATNAANSATSASNSASTATTQATNASNSASAASTSATNASNSATAAANSATAAANSATAAQTAETNAETAETNAAASASAASTSATNASNSASAASTSATNASNSASAAATSATNASNSASAASTSASNAATSATNAANSATAAAASYDSFDDRYLGAKSSAPTLDNDGNTLLVGALYYNTVSSAMKVWSGSSWLDAYASLSGALIATNNLSDLNNTATARTNLGVAIGTNVQAWDADLDTWATKTAPSGTVVGTSDSQTLTNKTLTDPTINGSVATTGINFDSNTFVIDATNNRVGVATASPTVALDVTGSIKSSALTSGRVAYSTTSGQITDSSALTFDGTNFATSNNMRVTGSTASYASGTGTEIAYISASTKGGIQVYDRTANAYRDVFIDGANALIQTGGTERMRITSTGNVGIGTSSPSAKLDVSGGNIRAIGGSNALIGAYGANNTSPQIALGNAAGTNHWLFYETLGASGEQGSVNIYDFPTGTNRLTITTTGNVGIGTSSPVTKLQVLAGRTTLNANNEQYALMVNNGSATNGYYIGSSAANTLNFSNSSGVETMRIDSSGNVGIGTTSPATKLHVNDGTVRITSSAGSAFGLAIFSNGQSSGQLIVGQGYASATDNIAYVQNQSNAALAFGTNGTERMRIDSSGNLLFNSGYGSVATAYGCRAWVNFNGTGTVAIRGSGNVTSITDRGTGEYTLNFTNSLPDANYCGVASATIGGSNNSNRDAAVGNINTSSAYCNSWVADTGAFIDVDVICAAIFR